MTLGAAHPVLERRSGTGEHALHRLYGPRRVVERPAWVLVATLGTIVTVGATLADASRGVLGSLAVTAAVATVAVLAREVANAPVRVAIVGSSSFCAGAADEARDSGRTVVATVCGPDSAVLDDDAALVDELVVEISAVGLANDVIPDLCDRASRVLVVDPADSANRDLFAPVLSMTARVMKRTVDILAACIALLVGVPVCLVVALAIKTDSHGPVFFIQSRVGIDGRRFRLYKFRTMFLDNDDSAHRAYVESLIHGGAAKSGPMFKLADDPRITRVGRVLRRYSIDELPQLLNVLKGDMSIVGPRPPLPSEVAHYDGWAWQRLRVRPGVTGLWQVRGRSLLDFQQMVDLDVEYWTTWNVAREFSILARTPAAVLSARGAA